MCGFPNFSLTNLIKYVILLSFPLYDVVSKIVALSEDIHQTSEQGTCVDSLSAALFCFQRFCLLCYGRGCQQGDFRRKGGKMVSTANKNLWMDISEHIDETRDLLKKICGAFCSGLMTDEEFFRCFTIELHQNFYDYLRAKGLVFTITEKTWSRFRKDYRSWREEGLPESDPVVPWLYFAGDARAEAGTSEKACFFRLMDAFYMPPEFFRPLPDNCRTPKWFHAIYGDGSTATIEFSLTDDGGLFTSPNPVGQVFTLTDMYGLKAKLDIRGRVSEEETLRNNRYHPEFTGFGTIEGYTSSRERRISITASDVHHKVWLYTAIDNEDLEVFRRFPLWADYHNRTEAHDRWVREEYLPSLIAHF